MSENTNCPNCGKALPAGALEGLCPECMLKVGAVADSVPETVLASDGSAGLSGPTSPPVAAPTMGEEFGGYRVLRRLGHGGMGTVYEAEEKESGRRVALKVIHQKLGSSHDRARFLREGRLAASVNHPNCVYVFGTEDIEGTPVIAMEFVPGGTLQQRLTAEGPLPIGRAVDAVLQIIDGLEAAQAVGILHRDIKPSNCFEAPNGVVKIGDFGLSISTLPREETNITESGAMVGTPAFCSPEQLRGEELNARSDMYAVGVTLYQLLTGRLPFEGKTVPQLIANTLEKRAPSPRQFRPDLPNGLARVILRCLEKQPSERFKSYADLRRALEPYSSAAPTPATLGLRFVAGTVDFVLVSAIGQVGTFVLYGGPFAMMERVAQHPATGFLLMLPWLALAVAYFALPEWRWGATPGKALCRVRVVREDRNFPSLGAALGRALIYLGLPMLPYWLAMSGDPFAFAGQSGWAMVLGLSWYVLLALLFVTARRRNGYASIHDLLTRTRVIARTALSLRPQLPTAELPPGTVESNPRIGPYHVLEQLGESNGVEWVMGYDLRLLRRVLVRRVPAGTPLLPEKQRQLARVGRLRWLTGRRDTDENWDAFEGVPGRSLADLIEHPQPWAQVRFWLHDLAEELVAAVKDDTLPDVLALDRVWITHEGRVKLLDFPPPGAPSLGTARPAHPAEPPQSAVARAKAFFIEVAEATLLPGRTGARPAPRGRAPLPVHARRFLESLPSLANLDAAVDTLKRLLRRPAEVTRLRRAMLVLGCALFPILMSLGAAVGVGMLKNWNAQEPELMELSGVLNAWKAGKSPWMPQGRGPSDQDYGIYIAAHFRETITNETVWSSALARMFIAPKAREFAEKSLVAHASPSAEELAAAEAAVKPIAQQGNPFTTSRGTDERQVSFVGTSWFPMLLIWATLMVYVALPAIVAALAFRGGLMLLATGVTYVTRDGRMASRLRLLWRSLVCWSPVFVAGVMGVVGAQQKFALLVALSAVGMAALVAISLLLPQRGLQDRLAGTWPVPR